MRVLFVCALLACATLRNDNAEIRCSKCGISSAVSFHGRVFVNGANKHMFTTPLTRRLRHVVCRLSSGVSHSWPERREANENTDEIAVNTQ